MGKYTSIHTKEEILNQYKELRKKMGRVPKSTDDRALFDRVRRHPELRTWKKIMELAGDSYYTYNGASPKALYTVHELLIQYWDLKDRLGRQPTVKDAESLRKRAIRNPEVGSWNNLVKLAGDVPLQVYDGWTVEQLIEQYLELKKRLFRQPIGDDDRTLVGRAEKHPELGSWKALVEAAGDTIIQGGKIGPRSPIRLDMFN